MTSLGTTSFRHGRDATLERLPTLEDVPPAPRQPSRQARRIVFGYRGGQGVLALVGAGFLLVGTGFVILLCWGLPVDIAIALSPVRTEGVLVSVDPNRGLRVGSDYPARVRYTYEVRGAWFVGEAYAVAVATGRRGTVEVEHASFRPGWSRMAGTTHARLGYLGLLVLPFPVLGAALLAFAIRSNRREIRAFTRGRPILARITFRGLDESASVNGRHPFMLRWEFRTEDGDVHEGSLTSMKLLELEPLGAAEEVVVLYDPENPRANTLFVP